MAKRQNRSKKDKSFSLLLSIILVFCILGGVVFSVSRKISVEMSTSAIQNLSETLNLIKSTIEAILNNEAEFQKIMAQEIAHTENLEDYIRSYQKNQTMVKISLIRAGKTEGISNTGEPFTEEELDFSSGGSINGLAVSQSYLNYMGKMIEKLQLCILNIHMIFLTNHSRMGFTIKRQCCILWMQKVNVLC